MSQFKEINRLVKKGMFDQRLKEQKQKREFFKSLKITGLSLIFLISLLFLIQLIPSSSMEITPQTEGIVATKPQEKKTNIFKSLIPLSKNSQADDLNILALGRPGSGYSGQNLTDTIILIHLSPNKEKAVLISLPRDLLVEISGRLTKINSLYSLYGIEQLKEKVSEITGFSVDKHILVDLVVVKEIIDLVDGLNIYVPQDINDPYFPGPNYSYQTFNLSAGWRYLDGETALRYVRTRYTSPNGDFDRMARQQQVIQLLKQKVLALNPLWDLPTYLKIFNRLTDHIETNLSILELRSLYQTTRKIQIDQIASLVIDKKETNLLTGGLVTLGQQNASVVYPILGQGNYSQIQEYIKQYINL